MNIKINQLSKRMLNSKILSLKLFKISKFRFSTNNLSNSSVTNIKTENKEKNELNVKEIKPSSTDVEILKQQAIEEYNIYGNSTIESVEKLKKIGINIEDQIKFREEMKEIINNDKQHEYFEKTGIMILQNKNAFTMSNLDPHNYLVKYRDKNYKVDIKEVLTRDLYEKQRVVDKYVEERKEKVKLMLNSHENRFKVFSNKNTFLYLVYKNPYSKDLIHNFEVKVRLGIISSLAFIAISGSTLSLLAPFAVIDLLKAIKAIYFHRKIVDEIYLYPDKTKVLIHTFKPFSHNSIYKRKFEEIKDINVLKNEYTNEFSSIYTKSSSDEINLDLNSNSSFFSIKKSRSIFKNLNKIFNNEFMPLYTISNWIFNLFSKSNKTTLNQSKNELSDNLINENKFISFHQINTNKNLYFLPKSNKQHSLTYEDLTLKILNGDFEAVANYDFTNLENMYMDSYNEYVKLKKYEKFLNGESYTSELEKLEIKYCDYDQNNDFKADDKDDFYKRDKSNGYFIDNGYR